MTVKQEICAVKCANENWHMMGLICGASVHERVFLLPRSEWSYLLCMSQFVLDKNKIEMDWRSTNSEDWSLVLLYLLWLFCYLSAFDWELPLLESCYLWTKSLRQGIMLKKLFHLRLLKSKYVRDEFFLQCFTNMACSTVTNAVHCSPFQKSNEGAWICQQQWRFLKRCNSRT